jgi:hypothetical protein
MQFSRWKKLILWSIGSLILGALGSGLWELALKPGGQWITHLILTAATLGSMSLKDGVYRQAAKGLHEEAAFSILVDFSFWIVAILAVLGVMGLLKMKDNLRKMEALKVRLDSLTEPRGDEEEGNNREIDIASLGSEIWNFREKTRRQMRVMLYATVIVVALNAGSRFIEILKISEANGAYTFFRQSMAICRPYVSDQQAQMIKSRFAAINGRADYLTIIDELQHIAASHQRKLPEFSPW